MSFDFSILEQSGVSQKEFADLVGVSRVVVNRYIHGKTGVGSKTAPDVKRVLTLLKVCVKLRTLPADLPARSRHYTEQRRAYIAQALKRAEVAVQAAKARRAQQSE